MKNEHSNTQKQALNKFSTSNATSALSSQPKTNLKKRVNSTAKAPTTNSYPKPISKKNLISHNTPMPIFTPSSPDIRTKPIGRG